MSDQLVGHRESFLRGHQEGYAECLKDIENEMKLLQDRLNTITLPIIEGIFINLEKRHLKKSGYIEDFDAGINTLMAKASHQGLTENEKKELQRLIHDKKEYYCKK